MLLVVAGISACSGVEDQPILRIEGAEGGDCSDEADNDQDGLFDCDDEGCTDSPACDVVEVDFDATTDSEPTDTDEEAGVSDETTDSGMPVEVDGDGDGFTLSAGDCNDAEASIHPHAIEIWEDGIDQDCDGFDSVYCSGDRTLAAATGCTVIEGELFVTDVPVTDLSSLSALEAVGGTIWIHQNRFLKSLEGLERLESVIGHFYIANNEGLIDISALLNLAYAGDANSAEVLGNPLLCSSYVTEFLDHLSSVGGWYNPSYIINNDDGC